MLALNLPERVGEVMEKVEGRVEREAEVGRRPQPVRPWTDFFESFQIRQNWERRGEERRG